MIGALLGNRYELLEKIGEGGMAEVYKARCHILNRFVAIKILKKEYNEDSSFIEKFRREAFAAASLTHPNIVQIYDVGRDNNLNYIVFEFVDGYTLKDVIRKYGKLDNQAIINYSIQICKALMCAHKNGIIHRDIKPHNILVTNEGTLKVTDFGIAKASTSSTVTTSGEKILGTPYYLSPEQARGDSVDMRSDLYSFGIVMYEMCAGVVPFVGDNLVTVVLKHVQEAPKPPIEINAEVTDSLNNIVLRLIQKSPQERYQDANHVLTDLRKMQNSQVIYFHPEESRTSILDTSKVSDFGGNTASIEKTVDEYRGKENKWKWRIITSILIIIAILGGVVFGKIWVDNTTNTTSNTSNTTDEILTIPDIIGKTLEEAEDILTEKGLLLKQGYTEYSDTVDEGRIIKIDGGNVGDITKKDTEISVVVSLGKEKVEIPDVSNLTANNAQELLKQNRLKVTIESDYNLNIPLNIAIKTEPEAGTPVDVNSDVILYVSLGPEVAKVYVPDLIGAEINEAIRILDGKGLNHRVLQYSTSDPNLDLQVKSTYPLANEEVPPGAIIEITYYQYEEPQNTTNVDTTQDTTNQNTTNSTNTTDNTDSTIDTTDEDTSSSSINTTVNTSVNSVNDIPQDDARITTAFQ